MKSFIIIFLFSICNIQFLFSQDKTENSIGSKALSDNDIYYSNSITNADTSIIALRIAYFKLLGDTAISTEIIRFETDSKVSQKQILNSMPNDTIISPTIRYYPSKRKNIESDQNDDATKDE